MVRPELVGAALHALEWSVSRKLLGALARLAAAPTGGRSLAFAGKLLRHSGDVQGAADAYCRASRRRPEERLWAHRAAMLMLLASGDPRTCPDDPLVLLDVGLVEEGLARLDGSTVA